MTAQEIMDEQARIAMNREFSNSDVTQFMQDLASESELSAKEWMESNGCDSMPDYAADLLQSMAVTSIAGHLTIPGSDRFWQAMKQLAMQKFDFDRS